MAAVLDELDHPERDAARGAGRRHQRQGQRGGHGPIRAAAPPACVSAPCRSRTWSAIASGSRSMACPTQRAALRRRRGRHVLPAVDRVAARLGPTNRVRGADRGRLRRAVRRRVRPGAGGGRAWAAAWTRPTSSIQGWRSITNVQHDHERLPGHRRWPPSAAEKAAIIKPGNLAVSGATRPRAAADPCNAAAELARLPASGGPRAAVSRHPAARRLGRARGRRRRRPTARWTDLRVGLLGGHQAHNAAVALALLDALRQDAGRRGSDLPSPDDAALRRGLAAARWPGRLELLHDTPRGRVLLDGAHNPAGARALTAALRELGLRRFPLLFGAMRGKRVSAVLRAHRAARATADLHRRAGSRGTPARVPAGGLASSGASG